MSLTKARELAVLSLLNTHSLHGYQVAAAFEKWPLHSLGLKRAAVYSILARFSERGWITVEEQAGGQFPDRRVSHITDQGRAAIHPLAAEAGGLSLSPLMALMLLHDSGVDVTEMVEAQCAMRRRIVAEHHKTDKDHVNSASRQLAYATTIAEIDFLSRFLEGHSQE